jgi:undecaprenyl-diphosphatase
MKAHSDPKVSGWYLVVGALLFVGMTVALGFISEDVTNHEPLTVVDAEISGWFNAHRSPPLTTAMLAFTSLGSTGVVILITVGFLIYLLARRRYFWIAAVLAAVPGGMLLNKLLKYEVHRARPQFDDPILTLTSYSFPSGHTMMATVLYGVIAAYLFSRTTDRRRRALIILAAALLMVLVGFSRICLGAHYFSDVLAAMAEGLAWVSLCLMVLYTIWQRYGKRKRAG